MATIGQATDRADRSDSLGRARERAAMLPELIIESLRISNTVIAGWHGRKKRGIGETFWQYRPHVEGENLARIDWRRSARDDDTYVRDLEWEAAHTVWLWVDESPSMLYQSKAARISKEARALVLAFSLAELLSRGGERVGYPGLLKPVVTRNGAERLAAALTTEARANTVDNHPPLDQVGRFNDFILISDFLQPFDETQVLLEAISNRGARAHLIEITDPAEEAFPYAGRTEFIDPETGQKLTAGRAEIWADAYKQVHAARRSSLAEYCRRLGWSHTVSHTDRLASEALTHVFGHLSGQPLGSQPQRKAG